MTMEITNSRANVYAGLPLDRAAHLRQDPARLAAALASPAALAVPVLGSFNLLAGEPQAPRAVLVPLGALPPGQTPIFLGLMGETPLFAVDLAGFDGPEAVLDHPALAPFAARFEDLRGAGPLMEGGEAGILGYARGMAWWNRQTGFCGVCGHPTRPEQAGFVRRCTNPDCNRDHFPRTDPAVIMLVHDGAGRVLMARQRAWVSGIYSVLAGFVEPGESLEDAVAREVMEEAGIAVTDIRYHSSQPWPFPCSLMLGFTARALHDELSVDHEELETALWVERSRLRTLRPDDPVQLPRLDSIARRLLNEWIASDD
jgi:NAD+ diphosphatase